MASDQFYREADLAIDFCEDVPRLPDADIDRIVAIMHESGMTVRVSSIHVNGWFGSYDKLGMTDLRNDAERVMKTNFPDSKYLSGKAAKDTRWWQIWTTN